MIIVDEEHDQSYKQDEGVIYNARDMAIARASFENIPINLITAVPSIETYDNIKKGKYTCSQEGKCEFIFSGPGVERISEEVKKNFPLKKVEIFSSDTMNKKDSSEKLKKIINNEIDILVGTQLISKGFHFPSLNCIIVVDIDLSTQGHDLRAAEKNLQLYHQLSGRAGRTGKPAIVYFQTYNRNTNMISEITNSNPDVFLDRELQIRKKNKLPPFERFISLILTGENEQKLEKDAFYFKNFLKDKINAKVLGPVSAPIFRLKRKFRVRLLIRGTKSLKLQNSIAELITKYKFSNGIKLTVDVDPINFN